MADPGRRASKKDVARFLKEVGSRDEFYFYGDAERMTPNSESAMVRAVADNLVFVDGDRSWEVRRIHLLEGGEKFLKRWKWRWLRLPALIVGGVVVAVDAAFSLVAQAMEFWSRLGVAGG